jgi:hypothetical protein
MSPECSRLSFMVGCFWHGSGTPSSRTPSDHLFRSYGWTVQGRPAVGAYSADVPGLSFHVDSGPRAWQQSSARSQTVVMGAGFLLRGRAAGQRCWAASLGLSPEGGAGLIG